MSKAIIIVNHIKSEKIAVKIATGELISLGILTQTKYRVESQS